MASILYAFTIFAIDTKVFVTITNNCSTTKQNKKVISCARTHTHSTHPYYYTNTILTDISTQTWISQFPILWILSGPTKTSVYIIIHCMTHSASALCSVHQNHRNQTMTKMTEITMTIYDDDNDKNFTKKTNTRVHSSDVNKTETFFSRPRLYFLSMRCLETKTSVSRTTSVVQNSPSRPWSPSPHV